MINCQNFDCTLSNYCSKQLLQQQSSSRHCSKHPQMTQSVAMAVITAKLLQRRTDGLNTKTISLTCFHQCCQSTIFAACCKQQRQQKCLWKEMWQPLSGSYSWYMPSCIQLSQLLRQPCMLIDYTYVCITQFIFHRRMNVR